jgi:hypothetical protein
LNGGTWKRLDGDDDLAKRRSSALKLNSNRRRKGRNRYRVLKACDHLNKVAGRLFSRRLDLFGLIEGHPKPIAVVSIHLADLGFDLVRRECSRPDQHGAEYQRTDWRKHQLASDK